MFKQIVALARAGAIPPPKPSWIETRLIACEAAVFERLGERGQSRVKHNRRRAAST